MVIGVLGIACISLVVLCVVVLDFTTLAMQLKLMKSNLSNAWTAKAAVGTASPGPGPCQGSSALQPEPLPQPLPGTASNA